MVVQSIKFEFDKDGLREFRALVERLVNAVEKSTEIVEKSTRDNAALSIQIDDGK